jgi:hypothetical protein
MASIAIPRELQDTPDTVNKEWFEIYMESTGLPIYTGNSVEDLRTVELGKWPEREVNACFVELSGQEGITEGRVEEIAPGKTLEAHRFAIDQLVYCLTGQGVTSVWTDGMPKKTFEWSPRSLFLLPGNAHYQITNMQGDKPARLLYYSYMPLAMSVLPKWEFLFNSPLDQPERVYQNENPYADASQQKGRGWGHGPLRNVWTGNFFPDLSAWDRLTNSQGRGAGGASVMMRMPGTELSCHMSVFPPLTYKKAHRHGPGRLIVIPAGEGFSVLWLEGHEKIVVPWHEGSVFVPPDRYFHQHFNLGGEPARYLALHPPIQFKGQSEQVQDRERDQIEYTQEDPFIRELFEGELAKRGLKSAMPDEAYKNKDYVFAAAIAGGD